MSKRISEAEAASALRACGFEPLEPFPGAGKPWRARCDGCKQERAPRWSRGKTPGCGVCAGNEPIPAE